MKKLTAKEKYFYRIRKEQRALENYVATELRWAESIIKRCRQLRRDCLESVYRACLYFRNREYLGKPESLVLLYNLAELARKEAEQNKELDEWTKAIYRFKIYTQSLKQEGV
jgi:hypothetical protein